MPEDQAKAKLGILPRLLSLGPLRDPEERRKAIGEGPESPQSQTLGNASDCVCLVPSGKDFFFLLVSQPYSSEWSGQPNDQEVQVERDTGTVCESRFAHLLEYEVQIAWERLINMVMPASVHHFKL